MFQSIAARCWLGFVLDFEKGKIHIEEEKMVALIDSIDGLLASHQMVHVRMLASVVGQIISMSRAIGYIARLFTRHLHATVSRRFSWNSYVFWDVRSKAELEFWKANIHHLNGHSMWFASSAVRTAYSDASGLGYGGFAVEHADKIVHGQWTLEEQYKSSTWREMVAVRRVLVEIAPLLAGLCVKWCSDNQNVVHILHSGSRKGDLQDEAIAIFSICAEHSIRLEPVWVPREDNGYADYVSKLADVDDWYLNPDVFR